MRSLHSKPVLAVMNHHATLAMTFIVEISSLRGGSSPTRQSTYGSPRCARDDGWVEVL
ncbi:MAG: hypothetical protein ACPGK1_06495 [bacterium]